MKIIYSDNELPRQINKSIFLAGPSHRIPNTNSWRHETIKILEKLNYEGHVFIPIPEKMFKGELNLGFDYLTQINWEIQAREKADIILFWFNRSFNDDLMGLTTNIEFGEDLKSGKIKCGIPSSADKCEYIRERIKLLHLDTFDSLDGLVSNCVITLGEGSFRENGETAVPLFIWQSSQFQNWYSDLKLAGNRLDDAKVLFHFKINGKFLFCHTLWVKIWITNENRYKENELVFSRKDISSIFAYYKNEINETMLVLVSEFRSPVSSKSGKVLELAGGSSIAKDIDARLNAKEELEEEIGVSITNLERFKYVNTRQLNNTLSSHKCHLYKVELSKDEFLEIEKNYKEKKTFGLTTDSEQTTIKIINSKDIFKEDIDYAMLGMIFEALE